jgi:hypothetical protein
MKLVGTLPAFAAGSALAPFSCTVMRGISDAVGIDP